MGEFNMNSSYKTRFPRRLSLIGATKPRTGAFLRAATSGHCWAFIAGVAVLGCSQGPPAFHAPDIDASAATEKAFELYDKNRDGALDETELISCPGVLAALSVYDANGNKGIGKSEMTARIEAWVKSPAMMSLDCHVTLDGRALEGAEVVYDPEPYLADVLHPAKGVTKANGVTAIGIPAELMDERHKGVKALNAGVYKIRVTHPSIAIKPIYNSETTLGREISMETRPTIEELALTSK